MENMKEFGDSEERNVHEILTSHGSEKKYDINRHSSKSVSIHKDFTQVNVLFGSNKTGGNKGNIYLKL